NIAREAIGNDPARTGANTSPTPGASPGASPVPTVTPYHGRDLSFTVGSPAYLQTNAAENQSVQDVKTLTVTDQTKTGTTSPVVAQSRANTTQTLFVEDVVAKPTTPLVVPIENRIAMKSTPSEVAKPVVAVMPPFGTLLPVRTQGVIFTLRNNSY